MATTPPRVDPRTVVKTSSRLWSEEVALADPGDNVLDPHDPAYEFTNGTKKVEKSHYNNGQGNG